MSIDKNFDLIKHYKKAKFRTIECLDSIDSKNNKDIINPDTYNNISLPILVNICDLIINIANNFEILPQYNLGLIVAPDLQRVISQHYFFEYEKNFLDKEKNINKKSSNEYSVLIKLSILINGILHSQRITKSNTKINIGYIGFTTVSWSKLKKELKKINLNLCKVELPKKIFISKFELQYKEIKKTLESIHEEFCATLKVDSTQIRFFDINNYIKSLDFISKTKVDYNFKELDFIITGTMGNPMLRAMILNFQANNVPTAMCHHGAQYLIYDEPFYDIYEGDIPDKKIVFGNAEDLKKIDALGPTKNIWGKEIIFKSRTDDFIRLNKSNKKINIIKNLDNKKITYYATEFTSDRYGPHRDINPLIYLEWQLKLINWLNKFDNIDLTIKLHPKRSTKFFDPIDANNNIVKENFFKETDVFVVDYPTTSLAHVSSTSKPVIFFDLGLRKIHNKAMKMIQDRCIYSKIDFSNIDNGLEVASDQFSNSFNNNFTETFCIGEKSIDEVVAIREIVKEMINQT